MNRNNRKLPFSKAVSLNNRAWGIWWKLCPGLFFSFFLSGLCAGLSPYAAIWLSARIITELSGDQNPEVLVRLVGAQLAVTAFLTFLEGILNRLKRYYTDCAGCLYDRIYTDKLCSLDYHQIDTQSTYDLYSRIRQDDKWSSLGIHESMILFDKCITGAIGVLGGIILTVPLFLSPVPRAAGSLALLNHPLCGILIPGFMLSVAVLSPVCAGRVQAYWTRYASETRFGNRLADFYVSAARDRKRAPDMRMYRQQEHISGLYMERYNPFGLSSRIVRWARGPMGMWAALSQCMSVILTSAVYGFVCLKAWAGAFGLGQVTLYTGAITLQFAAISRLFDAFGRMAANGSFLETAYEFLDIPNTMYQGSLTTEKRSDRQYDIEFRDVSFRYPGTKEYALRHVSMRFPIGSRLAVVGMNGSGKTTFIKLLCRLYDPDEGEILLNGIDIRKYKYEDYINLFSVVFQDFKLFSLPLGENIAASSCPDEDRASGALQKAGFTNWKTVMPQGLSTCLYKDLDSHGVEISGGEAQKIAIARALYKDAPFIILDEPTAALDPVAEADIYQRFAAITGDRTAVCISHRLSSCRFCDKILVFHKGTIVQQGSHEQLAADTAGIYHELWNAQAQYYRLNKT